MIPFDCHFCGKVDEARFEFSGPHIKQVCNGCGKYVKFFSKSSLPDVKEIKYRILSVTNDLNLIQDGIKSLGFTSELTGVDAKIMYWRLYLKLREVCL